MALTVYGKPECTDWARSRALLESHGIDYNFLDILASTSEAEKAQEISGGPSSPVIIFPDGSFVVEPSDEALTEALKSNNML
jgi:mycoredoxin